MRAEARPFLNFKVSGTDVDVPRYVPINTDAGSESEVAACLGIGEAARLRSETAKAKQQFGVPVDFLVMVDRARAGQISIFADVGRGSYVVVNLTLHSKVIHKIEVTPKCQALNVALTIVGGGD